MGKSYCSPVAAIKASANVIFLFCLIPMAISLMSSLYGMITQSFRSALQDLISDAVIEGLPRSSISVTKETANNFSVYGKSRLSPSNKLIRIFVSARKSIFTPCLFLIGQSIKPTFQCSEVFFKRWLLLLLLKFSQRPTDFIVRCSFF